MAGQSAKKVAKNAQSKSTYYAVAALLGFCANFVHLLVISRDYSVMSLCKVLFLGIMSLSSYKMIMSALTLGVGYELWLDLFIINILVQVFSCWSSWFWILYLSVPGYGLYHVGGYIKAWIFARRDEAQQPDSQRQGKAKSRR